jgi:hypothetical protein
MVHEGPRRKVIGAAVKSETYYGELNDKIGILKRLESRVDD